MLKRLWSCFLNKFCEVAVEVVRKKMTNDPEFRQQVIGVVRASTRVNLILNDSAMVSLVEDEQFRADLIEHLCANMELEVDIDGEDDDPADFWKRKHCTDDL